MIDLNCVFGDWDCPVAVRLEEMQREIVAVMRTTSSDPEVDKIFQEYMGKLIGAVSSPLVALGNFCQACPIVKEKHSVYYGKTKFDENDVVEGLE